MVNGNRRWVLFFLLGTCLFAPWAWAWGPQDTFSYQGELRANGEPFDGVVTLSFRLFDREHGGLEVADEVTLDDVLVADGRFTVDLDFGPDAFAGISSRSRRRTGRPVWPASKF